MDNPYVLYILMRSDMASLNPGKAMAQAAHAANHFIDHNKLTLKKEIHEWCYCGTYSFGTTIVLEVNEEELDFQIGRSFNVFPITTLTRGRILDPTYPIKDGEVTHILPVRTCGYIFGRKDELSPYVGHLKLYK